MHNFHPDEIAALGAAPAADSRDAMMRCWARKEAVFKAIGPELPLPLDVYAVDCGNVARDWL